MPPSYAALLDRAIAASDPEQADVLRCHYFERMPAARLEALAHPVYTTPLDWDRLPRLGGAVAALVRTLAAVNVRLPTEPFESRTLGALYEQTFFGAFMPPLYGWPGDLAAFQGGDVHAFIDEYLAAPTVHELCHLHRQRPTVGLPYFDECIAGYLGASVLPTTVAPLPGRRNALMGAPWFAQLGQCFVRAFGLGPLLAAHAGQRTFAELMGSDRHAELLKRGWEHWLQDRSLAFLSGNIEPERWTGLLLEGVDPNDFTPFDFTMLVDALRAMCLVNEREGLTWRVRLEAPPQAIVVDADSGWMTREQSTDRLDLAPPRCVLSPPVRHRIRQRIGRRVELKLSSARGLHRVAKKLLLDA